MEKKIKRKKFNFLKFLIIILFIYLIVVVVLEMISLPIKNILIIGNNYVKDIEIIEKAKIEKYPSFYKTYSNTITKRILKHDLIKEVKIKKNYLKRIIKIEVVENKILFKEDNKYILENGMIIKSDIENIPLLINFVPESIKKEMIKDFSSLDQSIINKISEIEYSPTSYDEKRYKLYMNDKNLVFITLNKLNNLNKYLSIVKQLEGHTGILYLDSGNYFEIKK